VADADGLRRRRCVIASRAARHVPLLLRPPFPGVVVNYCNAPASLQWNSSCSERQTAPCLLTEARACLYLPPFHATRRACAPQRVGPTFSSNLATLDIRPPNLTTSPELLCPVVCRPFPPESTLRRCPCGQCPQCPSRVRKCP